MPELSEKQKRCHLFQFVMTDDELKQLKEAAYQYHMSESSFVRFKIFKGGD
jgi:hypothetical protein